MAHSGEGGDPERAVVATDDLARQVRQTLRYARRAIDRSTVLTLDHVVSYDHLVEISLEDRQAVTNFDKRRIPKNATRNPKADHGPHLH